jgi:hypothetical protein
MPLSIVPIAARHLLSFSARFWPSMPGPYWHGFPKLAFKTAGPPYRGAGYFYVAGTHNLLAELISDMQEMSR